MRMNKSLIVPLFAALVVSSCTSTGQSHYRKLNWGPVGHVVSVNSKDGTVVFEIEESKRSALRPGMKFLVRQSGKLLSGVKMVATEIKGDRAVAQLQPSSRAKDVKPGDIVEH